MLENIFFAVHQKKQKKRTFSLQKLKTGTYIFVGPK